MYFYNKNVEWIVNSFCNRSEIVLNPNKAKSFTQNLYDYIKKGYFAVNDLVKKVADTFSLKITTVNGLSFSKNIAESIAEFKEFIMRMKFIIVKTYKLSVVFR
ncbi:MAG: hypothetical protein ACI35P_00980 [Bacillus sp. (in: firmicutes)]